jgi:hypothetical protein
MSTTTVDTSVFNRMMGELEGATKRELPAIVKHEGMLMAESAMRITPPKTQAAGKGKIKAQMARIFFPLQGDMAFGFSKHDSPEINGVQVLWWKKNGTAYGVDKERYLPGGNLSQARSIMASRVSFEGKRTRLVNYIRTTDKTIHQSQQLKSIGLYALPESTLDALYAEKASHVGKLKSGWLAAVLGLGGKAPAWVKTQSGKLGTFQNLLSNSDQPTVVMENHAAGVERIAADMPAVINARVKAITKNVSLFIKGKKTKYGRN